MSAKRDRPGRWNVLRLAAVLGATCVAGASPTQEPVIGGPCEGCDEVFRDRPGTLASVARIAPANEPGAALRIEGTVRDAQGRAAPGIVVYAYHTNAQGIYPRAAAGDDGSASRHGRLRGWARTDAQGKYRFDTIRPAGYPDSDLPQHVHMHVIEVGRCTYVIGDLLFDDDPDLTAGQRRNTSSRGGPGIATPRRDASGVWLVTRDIVLGEGVPGYAEFAR